MKIMIQGLVLTSLLLTSVTAKDEHKSKEVVNKAEKKS